MTLQVAYGGVRVKRGPTTTRVFYCRTHGRVQPGDHDVRPALLKCAACMSFLDPAPRIGTREKIDRIRRKWRLD